MRDVLDAAARDRLGGVDTAGQPIVAGAALEQIRAAAALERVAAVATEHDIVAVVALEQVSVRTAVEPVVGGVARIHDIVLRYPQKRRET